MPASAFALVGLFTVVSLIAGIGAWWFVPPRRSVGWIAPSVAAFVALYLIGHRLGLSVGPTVALFGFQVSLVFDVAVAVVAAVAMALIQRPLIARRSRGVVQ
jgi:hypothetical protein